MRRWRAAARAARALRRGLRPRRTPSGGLDWRLGGLAVLDDYVLDRPRRGRANPADQIRAKPARACLGEGRDHDVVGGIELKSVLDRRVGVGMDALPDGFETR